MSYQTDQTRERLQLPHPYTIKKKKCRHSILQQSQTTITGHLANPRVSESQKTEHSMSSQWLQLSSAPTGDAAHSRCQLPILLLTCHPSICSDPLLSFMPPHSTNWTLTLCLVLTLRAAVASPCFLQLGWWIISLLGKLLYTSTHFPALASWVFLKLLFSLTFY